MNHFSILSSCFSPIYTMDITEHLDENLLYNHLNSIVKEKQPLKEIQPFQFKTEEQRIWFWNIHFFIIK